MKKIIKKIFKWGIILSVLVVSAIWIMGYRDYKQQIADVSLKDAVREVRNREDYVPYDSIPEIFLDATVYTEDERFYTRKSILDFEAVLRATWHNIKKMKLVEGGSTIPQQVSKNLYFENNHSLVRKVSEFFVTRDLLQEYSKEEILEIYVNVIYYGHSAYGVGPASKTYYNLKVGSLNEGELTLMAGLPQAPSVYDLTKNFDLARKRQKHVLSRLVYNDIITKEESMRIYQMEVRGYEKND